MRRSQLCAAILCGALCHAVAGTSVAEDADDEDPSARRIELGQLSALLDRATEATGHLDRKTPAPSGDNAESPLTIDIITKDVATELLQFRNTLLLRGLPGGNRKIQWPKWIFEPPTGSHSRKELQSRIDWLSEQVVAITDPVCEAAANATQDHLICSVE